MVVTLEENELLTRVGRGTPMGELIRRCCHRQALGEAAGIILRQGSVREQHRGKFDAPPVD